MADQDRAQRTEQPTDKRLREARERGQTPRSRELSMAAVMLAAAASLAVSRSGLGHELMRLLETGLSLRPAQLFDAERLPEALGQGLQVLLLVLAPVAGVTVVAAMASSLSFGGWVFSVEALTPKLERLDPMAGFRRIFSWNGVAELTKTMAKFGLVGLVAASMLWGMADELMQLGRVTTERGLIESARLASLSVLSLTAILVLIAAADVPFQYWQHKDRLKMSKQELKDELRDTEGKPELRSRIRSMQQEIATRRMMQEVPKADVVAVNPTHYAVALRYDAARMRAPRVVAKGSDLVALNIRKVAEEHGVPLFEHPPLAQALFHTTKLGAEIPQRLYVAVAQVLTYVYQLRGGRGAAKSDVAKPDVKIDPEILERYRPSAAPDAGVQA